MDSQTWMLLNDAFRLILILGLPLLGGLALSAVILTCIGFVTGYVDDGLAYALRLGIVACALLWSLSTVSTQLSELFTRSLLGG